MKAIRTFTVRPVLAESLAPLDRLASNWRWSWSRATHALFASMDPDLWERIGGNPSRMLGALGQDRLDELARDDEFIARVRDEEERLDAYLGGDRWFQHLEGPKPTGIAYFSPEFGVDGSLPQYSGGLGILAGDHLKSASDLGVPLTGVGLFYRAGYFRQSIGDDGWQRESYPLLDPYGLGLTLLRDADGAPVEITLDLPGDRQLHARVWVADIGRIPLLLMDSETPSNSEEMRRVTDRLYGGGGEHRLLQELLLGVGGVRAVRAFCEVTGRPKPDVYHTNEGHAGFQGLERMSELITQDGLSFDVALAQVRASTVFTTHTPVPAGIDRFPRDAHRGLPRERPVRGSRCHPRARARPRGLRGRRQGRLQHGGARPAPRSARERRLGAARRGQPRHVRRALARRRHRRGADHVDHQRRARPDVGAPGDQGRSASARSAMRTARRTTGPTARSSATASCGASGRR